MTDENAFKKAILEFNIKKVKPATLKKFLNDYVKNEDWDMEKLKRASKAMGPLGEFL